MSNFHSRREQKVFGPARIDSWLTFTTVDDDHPTLVEAQGIVSCERTGEGVFEIVLPEATKATKYQVLTQLETAVPLLQALVTDNDPATRTVELTLMDNSSEPTASDAAGTTIHVNISTRNY